MTKQQVLLLAYTFSAFSGGIFVPIYAFFVQKVGGGILETASAIALFSLASSFTTLIMITYNITQKYNLVIFKIGWFLWMISIFSYLFITNVSQLFIAQIFNGLGNALSTPIFDAEFSKDSAQNMLVGWGNFEALTSLITGIAALLGGLIVHAFGFNILIYLMCMTACISFIILLRYIKLKKLDL